MYQKPSETGWIYHAPSRPAVNTQAVGVPPASQIPGLAGDVGDYPPEPRPRILETDSKYVKLAKQGGREDLLQFKHPGKRTEAPKAYPRVDWFYLEDIRAEEAEKYNQEPKGKHNFMLPDYMVHEGYNPDGTAETDHRFTPKRIPYQFDQTTAFERDSHPCDKTVQLPNVKPCGYGVRTEKLKDKPVKHNISKPQRGKAPQAEYSPERKFESCLLPEDENPCMSKILSFGYARDWEDVREKWQQNQPADDKPGSQQNGRRGSGSKDILAAQKALKERELQKEKELFKMSRFANIKARTDSRRLPAKASSPPWGREDSEPNILVNATKHRASSPPWGLETTKVA